jgi:TIR domain
MPPVEVFLSHSTHDREMAEKVSRVLRDHGIPTFYSASNLLGAQQWQDEILRALRRCDWFAVLLSPNAVDSMWVKRETALALIDSRFHDRIVPLLYRPVDDWGSLEWLRIHQFVDFQGDFHAGCRDLLKVWGVGFKAST